MLHTTSRWLVALLFGLAASHASAEIEQASAEQLMRSSGLWQQLEGIAPQMRGAVTQGGNGRDPRFKPSEQQRLLRTVDAAYAADRLRATVRRQIAAATDAAQVASLQAWYGSPLGMNLARLEEASSADERDPMLVMREDAALFSQLVPARRALVGDLVQATHAADSTATLVINSMLAVQAGLASAMPEGPALSAREMRAALEGQRPQLVQAFGSAAAATFARIYAAVSDADLRQYAAFLKSPAGAHYNDLCLRAIDAALVEAGEALGRGVPGAKDAANI